MLNKSEKFSSLNLLFMAIISVLIKVSSPVIFFLPNIYEYFILRLFLNCLHDYSYPESVLARIDILFAVGNRC